MIFNRFSVLLMSLLMMVNLPVIGAERLSEADELAAAKAALKKNLPTMPVELIRKSQLDGFYEILSGGQIYYVSADGDYLLHGQLFSIKSGVKNLTEVSQAEIEMEAAPIRAEKLAKVSEEEMIIFKADDEKHVITVFTDVDCAYCRRLHKEMDSYNDIGITVRYMGFPRAGLGSPSHRKLQSVWCAKDPLKAMDKAKIDREFGNDSCFDPLSSHFELVREFGINGTPAVILKSGRLLPGYLPAEKLIGVIEEDERLLERSIAATSKQ